MQHLTALIGRWHGRGSGHFPTIDDFAYDEELVFEANDHEPLLHYVQKTWRLEGGVRVEPLHWESGFVIPQENGTIEISNAQNGGRVEVLAGPLKPTPNGFELDLASVVLTHDPRLHASHRLLRVAGNQLSYDVSMETTRVSPIHHHLRAELKRQPSDS
nr:FABP family protein [Acanthopleuribacter pedis]